MKRIALFLGLALITLILSILFSFCFFSNKNDITSRASISPNNISLSTLQQSTQTLRRLAQPHNLIVGAAVLTDRLQTDRTYQRLLAQEFSGITPENAMKFKALQPERNRYTFEDADMLTAFAQNHRMQIHGHTLVWYRSLPDWLTETQWNSAQLESILRQHIKTVVGHFRGKVQSWDVVNEAIDEEGRSFRDNLWLRGLGSRYIELAFRWAHEADPDARLFYNDYNGELLNAKSNTIYQMVKRLKQKNVPIHGVGLQMHTSINNPPDYRALAANIQRLADLGLAVRITEMDVRTERRFSSKADRLARQAQIYRSVMSVCLQDENCEAFSTWGVADHLSWLRLMMDRNDEPLLFDKQYQPKPAYRSLVELLRSTPS